MIEAVVQIIAYGLINPIVAVPAFVLGWVVRSWRLVFVGAVAIAAGLFAVSLLTFDGPPGSEIAWEALPLTIAPPLAWCAAGFVAGRWRRYRAGSAEVATATRIAAIVAGVVFGAVLGAAAGLGVGQVYVTMAQVSSFEGLSGYVVVYLFALPGLVLGAIAGGISANLLNRRLAKRAAV